MIRTGGQKGSTHSAMAFSDESYFKNRATHIHDLQTVFPDDMFLTGVSSWTRCNSAKKQNSNKMEQNNT